MSPLPRNAGRWIVLGTVATAIVMADPLGEEGTRETASVTAQARERVTSAPARAGQSQEGTAHVELERLKRAQPKTGKSNAFRANSWYVPPPPPPPLPPAPAPAPTAPPLPFVYLGRYEDAPTQLAILLRGERMYTVAVGEVIDETYRVERFTPGKVELLYLPLNIKQTLSTGEAP